MEDAHTLWLIKRSLSWRPLSHLAAKPWTKRALFKCCYLQSHVFTAQLRFKIFQHNGICASSFIFCSAGVLWLKCYLCFFSKRLQLSEAQNLGYIQLLAQKESAQQFITNIPEKPIHLQKQKHEGKCQPIILCILNSYSYKTFEIW